VVQLYLRHEGANAAAPIRSLQGFQRITLKPGESRRVEFKLTAAQMSLLNADNRREIGPGAIEISVGGKQPGFTGAADAASTQSISKALTVAGPAKILD
jgi:beta-glucosidase